MNQVPAGWYPSEGQERYWDGQRWTEHTRPLGTAQRPEASAPRVMSHGPVAASGGHPWYRKSGVIGVAAGLLGLIVGAAAVGSGETDPTTSSEYQAQAKKLAAAEDELASTKGDLSDAQQELETIAGDLPEREEAVKAKDAELDKREDKVAAAEKAVAAREKKVGIVEDQIAANTVAGDGVYKVGTDMKPGTYKTNGKRGCYYAVLNSTDSFDIAVNGNPDGPAFATVSVGQYFEVARCADWVLQQ